MKKYKSITNSMRHVLIIDKSFLSKKKKILSLIQIKNNFSGRNVSGHTTVFSKSNKNKSRNFYRIIDYKRLNHNIPGKIFRFEYDPNRSSFISLVRYYNNIYCYILGVKGTKIGDLLYSYNYNILAFKVYRYKKGDSNQIAFLVKGSILNNIEFNPGLGSRLVRSAGTYGLLLNKYNKINKALIELPSKIKVYLSIYSRATVGIICNEFHNKVSLGKAGRSRWLGKKPIVRGVAQNPIDHPHGGGEGKKNNSVLKKNAWGKALKWKTMSKKNVLYT